MEPYSVSQSADGTATPPDPAIESSSMSVAAFLVGASITAAVAVAQTLDVQLILRQRCLSCHGSKAQMHGLRLDHRADALKGGGSGVPAIIPRNSAQSLIIKYVSGLDPDVVMPPSGPRLTLTEIATLRAWIDGGAEWPGETTTDESAKKSKHWAFQPLTRPPVPATQDPWVRNPIDAFILHKPQAPPWKP